MKSWHNITIHKDSHGRATVAHAQLVLNSTFDVRLFI